MPGRYNFALLGDPVAHSRSPAIHRAALEVAELTGDYVPIQANRARLLEALRQLRSGELSGCNVTMPLKQDAFELCELLSGEAEEARSVNSLRLRDGLIEGHSTDVVAFREVLELDRLGALSRVLVVGSGGSARAAVAAVRSRDLLVTARNQAKALELGSGRVIGWGDPVPGALVVNATPLGMEGGSLPAPILEAAGGLIDLPYGETTTPSVLAAERRELPIVDGVEFLARQARSAFEWWTGVAVELDVLIRVARNV